MAERENLYFDRIETPIGKLVIVGDAQARCACSHSTMTIGDWRAACERRLPGAALTARRDPFGHVSMLKAYFKGDMEALGRIPVVFSGTPFQNKVWKALRKIPIGTTTSYGALAKKIGEPKAVRAVGLANGSNPIGVVVPCHRVIGSDGSLTGYGGGLPRKKWLLDHEARHCAPQFRLEASA